MIKKLNFPLLIAVFGLCLWSGCSEEEPTPPPAEPTITTALPDGADTPFVGTTVMITLNLAAEAGLSTLYLDDNSINTFTGTETEATIVHEQFIGSEDPIELVFSIEDALGIKATAATVTLNPVENPAIGFLLVDFSGTSSGNDTKEVASWDTRTIWTMGISGKIGSTATIENVAGQGKVAQFAATNPDPNETNKVLKYTKDQGATSSGAWGGWTNFIIGLESAVPTEETSELAKYDSASNTLVAGSRVVAVDVYYDATVDQDFTWSDIATFEDAGDIWNSDVTKGLKIDAVLGSYEIHANNEVGYDNQGYYISYSGYVPEPNKWVTVKFNLLDEGRTAFFYDNRNEDNTSSSVGPDMVDCINLKVSPGYDASSGGDGIDTNPIYFRNLRIINAE